MNATSDNYTKATGDGWIEFFVDDGRPVVRAEVCREEGRELLHAIAAAPETLAALREVRVAMISLLGWRDLDGTQIDQLLESDCLPAIDRAIVLATPAPVRRRVRVAVEVEIDTEDGESEEDISRRAVEIVREGEGQIVSHDLIS